MWKPVPSYNKYAFTIFSRLVRYIYERDLRLWMHIRDSGLEGTATGGYTVTPTGMIYTAYTVAGLMDPCTEKYLDCGIGVYHREMVEWFALHFGRSHSHRQTI